jgi:Oxidoreductase family, NAD-binding Rossmann fold
MSDEQPPSRRAFITTTIAGLGSALATPTLQGQSPAARPAPDTLLFRSEPLARIRVGFVGVGGMGTVHLENYLQLEGVEVRAVCDILEAHAERAKAKVVAAGQAPPRLYTRGPRDFERMCAEEELDLVFTATPWEWHVPVCLAAMRHDKHAVTEVPAAVTIDECWALVETAESRSRHCVMMENCCYDRRELLTLQLVRRGLLGELLHGECGYLHDLRGVKFSKEGEGLWRRAHSEKRNGNLYPTHGLGPIAQCMDINRGNQFDYLVSMSTNARGLALYASERLAADDVRRRETYKLGDVNVSLIRTVRGQTIYLSHNCDDPRPYSRINLLQGTRGIIQGWPDRVHIEGRSPDDQWEPLGRYYDEFEHPLWKSDRVKQASRGHGGMDFLEDFRLIECLRGGQPTDMNVYDAASWSAISELTERSVASGSQPIPVPDFTRGRWKTTPPLAIVS